MKLCRPIATRFQVSVLLLLAAGGFGGVAAAAQPTDAWLNYYGLQRWETVLDSDADGSSNEEEFRYGTHPRNLTSRPPRIYIRADGAGFEIPVVAGVDFGAAQLQTTTNLLDWLPVEGFPPAEAGLFTIPSRPDELARFFRIGTPLLGNSDGDCLLDFEELNLFHTDPTKTDTDGDGIDDCEEVTVFHTNPFGSPGTGRGSLSGIVVLDQDRDPNTQAHPGVGGWRVFVDLDFDGEWDWNEPNAETSADGRYEIRELDPGFYRLSLERRVSWLQIFPAASPALTPDGFPDRVVDVYDSGTGPIPFPYGRYVDPLPGLRLVFPSPPPDPVDASVVLGPLPISPISGPFGGWAHVDILAVPTNSHVTVAFDGEEIIDGPGADLVIWAAADAANEFAELYLGPTSSNLVLAGVFAQATSVPVDLAQAGITSPVRYLKFRGLGLIGTFPGYDLVGFEALHYRPVTRGHYEVTVVGGATVTDLNFGVAGEDRPPKVFITANPTDVRVGESLAASLTVSDDLGVVSTTLTANGQAIPLDATPAGVVRVNSPGLLSLAAHAIDSGGQSGSSVLTLIARNEDGTLPDLSGLGISGGAVEGGPSIQVFSPSSGEILTNQRTVLGTITGTALPVASWQVHYAPANLVNPLALDAPDADYILLQEGSGPVLAGDLGLLHGQTMPAGAYLLRVSAQDVQGTLRYSGFVFGVRIDPLDLRPEIVLTSPTNEASLTLGADIRGTIQTRDQLREWYAEFAPLSQVDLRRLADPSPSWQRIGSGTNVVVNGILARFDPTLLPNDTYVIRVSAWNANGQGWAEPLVVHVAGPKLGNFAVEYTDLNLPLAGVPIMVKRVYNSIDASRQGDFGYGWRMALQEADIAETIPQTGSGFGSTPFRVGARVYLTAPDGNRIGFTFEPEPGASSFLGAAYRAVFTPDPGVRYQLEVPEGDSSFLTLNTLGEAALFFIPVPWNPDTYILTDPEGIRYTYDQEDGLLEIADANGNRVSFNAEGISHTAGPIVQFTRDQSGRITRITAPDGRQWRYAYSTNGDLAEVVYPGDIVATFDYHAARPHYLERVHDPFQGPALRTEFDAAGRVAAVIDAQGNRREQAWDVTALTGTFRDARGNVTTLSYDARGNLTRLEDPLGGVTRWEYQDANHPDQPTAEVDPLGRRTTFAYTPGGNLSERRTPLGTTRVTYSSNEHPTRIVYANGGAEEFEWDPAGKLTRTKSQRGDVSFTYGANGLLASVFNDQGAFSRLEYEGGLASPARIVYADGHHKQFDYDAAGRLVRYTDPADGVEQFEYDSAGRLVRVVGITGNAQVTTYDPLFPNQPATVTDGAGRVTRYAYDTLGRLIMETGPGGAVTRYEYDADGNRTSVIDPLGNRYEFRYDALGRLIEEIDPLGQTRTHQYDPAGSRVESIDRNGRRRTFTYDAHLRLQEEKWHDPSDGSVVRTITHTYDRIDQLTTVTDPDARIDLGWLYVPEGPLLSEQASYTSAPARRIALAQDASSRRSGLSLTTTSPVLETALNLSYTRDFAGRPWIVENRTPLPPTQVTNSQFQLQFWRNPRGEVAEVQRFRDQNGDVQVSQSALVYTDPCGCRLDRVDHVIATNLPLPEATLEFGHAAGDELVTLLQGTNLLAFSHDAAGQLTAVHRNGAKVESYTYDTVGNRLASHRHSAYVTSAANRLTVAGDWSFTYDPEGNLVTKSNRVSGARFAYAWDHRNRLVSVDLQDPGDPEFSRVAEYRYDGLNRRTAVISGGHTNWTYYDGVQPIMDFVDQDTGPATIYYQGEQLDDLLAVWKRGQGLFWILTDSLGSPRRVLTRDGLDVGALEYDSFGNLVSRSGPNADVVGRFGFAGREWDEAAGLYYFRARYYDPDVGRFIQEDPLGFEAGDPNLYRYVFNRPTMFTDPTGRLAAMEYAALAAAMARPANFCKFALCVNTLWSGVAESVVHLTPAASPNANCAAELVGIPTTLREGLKQAGGAVKEGLQSRPGKVPNPLGDQMKDLGKCVFEATR